MRRAALVLVTACWALSALSLAEDGNPSATLSPPGEFTAFVSPAAATTTTAATNTTTTPVKTTTKPVKTTPKPVKTTTTAATNTTTTPVKTTPKPVKPTTKPVKTTPKPVKPTTKPVKPTTKPVKPTTKPVKPTTKPVKPTTKPVTTTKPTPSPPKPTPPTTLTVGNYTLKANQTVTCVMALMALQIRLAKPKAGGTFIVQRNMTKVAGSCQGTKANLTLVFQEGFITFMFNKTDKIVYVDALSFSLSYPLSKEANSPYTANNQSLHLFAAPIGHSYSCRAESFFMGNGLYLDVNQDQMQAFDLTPSNGFGTPESCPADKPDYRVAIAVGVTLLVLIIIVVVAYLLGRRRRTDGYQSL